MSGRFSCALFVLLAVLAAIGSPTSARAQEFRIGYITSWKIVGPESSFQPSKDAQAALTRDIETWNRELDDLQRTW